MAAIERSGLVGLYVQRIEQGRYIFGTKKISAKIQNGKLIIRVGGGYMSVDEFVSQYGSIELEKMQLDISPTRQSAMSTSFAQSNTNVSRKVGAVGNSTFGSKFAVDISSSPRRSNSKSPKKSPRRSPRRTNEKRIETTTYKMVESKNNI